MVYTSIGNEKHILLYDGIQNEYEENSSKGCQVSIYHDYIFKSFIYTQTCVCMHMWHVENRREDRLEKGRKLMRWRGKRDNEEPGR